MHLRSLRVLQALTAGGAQQVAAAAAAAAAATAAATAGMQIAHWGGS
jgi:hypothetical protein